jgi:hypothetical protein
MGLAKALGWEEVAAELGRRPRPPLPITLAIQEAMRPSPPPLTPDERRMAENEREARVIEDEVAAVLLDELRERAWASTSTSARTARASGDTPPTFRDVAGVTFEPADDTIWVAGQLELRGARFQRTAGAAPTVTDPGLRPVRDPQTISDAITAVYDGCDLRKEPIPNINETAVAVRNWLKASGLTATTAFIKEIAGQPQFVARRGAPGVHRRKQPPLFSFSV